MSGDWPVDLRGVTESLVTTLGPNDRWNVAALGLRAPNENVGSHAPNENVGSHAPNENVGSHAPNEDDGPVTARTWGRTRTRRNFAERSGGYVQFTRDPLTFVDATLSVAERDDPILAEADAVVDVDVERIDRGEERGTEWVDWAIEPVDATVYERIVPTTNRGYNAVVEATVAASRLDVAAYETADLLDRLEYFETIVAHCGGDRERAAFDRLRDLVDADW